MADNLRVLLVIALIAVTAVPVSLVMVDLNVPDWSLFAGHTGIFAIGLFCSTLLGRTNP